MKVKQWLAISRNGITRIRKSKPDLNWDEIAVCLNIEVPDELFKRPLIEAKLTITDVPNNTYDPEIILNTKELIEQQTGAKIEFSVVPVAEKKQED